VDIQRKISKEEMDALPVAEYTGRIVVISTTAEAVKAVHALRVSGNIIGFDTETRPAFKKGEVHKVALVQLSSGDLCFLFRLCRMKGLGPVREVLEDPSLLKVGISLHDDFANLRKWDKELAPQGFVELQQWVKPYGIEDNSLAKIYAIVRGKKMSKRQRLTNWENETLTDKQMAYAALDAAACVEIYEQLSQEQKSADDCRTV
jgi:ribonuclease D